MSCPLFEKRAEKTVLVSVQGGRGFTGTVFTEQLGLGLTSHISIHCYRWVPVITAVLAAKAKLPAPLPKAGTHSHLLTFRLMRGKMFSPGTLSFQQAASLSSDKEGLLYHKELVRSSTGRFVLGGEPKVCCYQVSFWQKETKVVILALPPVRRAQGRLSVNFSTETTIPMCLSHKMWEKCPNLHFPETHRKSGGQLA